MPKKNKFDEFYTLYSDIESELNHYDFSGKNVYCNCDDGFKSNFFLYFMRNFEKLKLSSLICTGISEDIDRIFVMYKKDYAIFKPIPTGDFRNNLEYLRNSDIIVTNPPFSLFREYIAKLFLYNKKFIIWGNINAITCKEIFPLIKENKMWFGYTANTTKIFKVPDYYEKFDKKITDKFNDGNKYCKLHNITVYTNLNVNKNYKYLNLCKEYNPKEYPKYDNYNAINVNKVSDIPKDYSKLMGVPITFLIKYNPKQFEIVGIDRYVADNPKYGSRFKINGKEIYARILIRKKNCLNKIIE